MKRQTRRNRYEKHRPIQLPKERPVQPTNEPINMDEWFAEWYENHRTQEQLVEMSKWWFKFLFQMSPEQSSQYLYDCIEFDSPGNQKLVYWFNVFMSTLSLDKRVIVLTWFSQWFNEHHPISSDCLDEWITNSEQFVFF